MGHYLSIDPNNEGWLSKPLTNPDAFDGAMRRMLGERPDLSDELTKYGALPSQLVDANHDNDPRTLGYLDLLAPSPGWRRPVVVENTGRPCVHVFDGRDGTTENQTAQWCWRIALRGDGAWIGVLEPGRLRVFRADVTHEQVKPVLVESFERGQWALPRFLNDVRAGQDDVARRRYLTQLLDGSLREASERGLSATDALSLVGRGLFWRFLVDRNLLVGLAPEEVCDKATTWEQCLDNKSRALRTFQWLDETFNGGLLPFEGKVREFDPTLFSSVLGNIAHGATETGQLRLPSDWREINFSYVPVGLLSEVYEAFAHHIDANEAARKSIHYTPSHLVDFIVGQALAQLPPGGRPRVLDPAAGAGVFLVTAFRKLVEREWQEKGERPKRKRIREILNKQLAGFDIDGRALRLAELALYLTALELDPKPKPLNELTFNALREQVLFDLSEKDHGSLGPMEDRFRGQFDLVIGNPPWTAKAKGEREKKAWVQSSQNIVTERLGKERAKVFDFPDMNTDLPFVWRALEWAKDGGRIALVTHARWLFGISERATHARNDLLHATRVTGILNGSALRLTSVWPEVAAPWCVLFATNEKPEPFDRAAFQFISPALDAEIDSEQARVRIDWLDAQVVLASEVVERPSTLKTKFRGNRLASRALESMRERGEALDKLFLKLGTTFKNGYQVGGNAGKQVDASHMIGMPDTKGAGPLDFIVDATTLLKFKRKTLLFPRDPKIYKGPVLLLRKAIPADLISPRAHLSTESLAFHESFHGMSFSAIANGGEIAGYLQLVLQSSMFPFFAILTDAQYGMFVDAIYLETVPHFPVVAFDRLSPLQRTRARHLSNRLISGWNKTLAEDIDTFVFDTFDLSNVERDAIRDTLDTALPSTESKHHAVRPPEDIERKRFVGVLQESLDNVLSASNLCTNVRERKDLRWSPWCILEVNVSRDRAWSADAPPIQAFLEEAETNGASLVIVRANDSTWFLGLLERYAMWTPTRARLLATDLIAERVSS